MNTAGTVCARAKGPETLTEKNTLLLVGGYFSLAFAVFQIEPARRRRRASRKVIVFFRREIS